ncbi:uncharacterized protein B0I36DRAFT_329509 [Microdochium trichocladiopsis]|uniref:Uncharacterized protein n=1 Tax=Microdochium trichocladiopsis TaxID=1682393 RepID=A0A9P9BM55_9PEZI|nr:uncharacterized protein B0I36DRAFT_329509 [Microdochium trichocladiopsis]KAH7025945.1 hypothetical protein B0I36DRAFT_329509 [Microdochium trichocladiopsis]
MLALGLTADMLKSDVGRRRLLFDGVIPPSMYGSRVLYMNDRVFSPWHGAQFPTPPTQTHAEPCIPDNQRDMSPEQLNNYWIPNWSIHKRVLTQQLQCYLGPCATVRPYTRHGEDGFLITTPGACLTDEQIDDICLKSKDIWDRQAAAKLRSTPEKPLKRPLHQPILVSQIRSSAPRLRGRAARRAREPRPLSR